MNNFYSFVTPEEYIDLCEQDGLPHETLKELTALASAPAKKCEVCEEEDVWRLAGTGLCFSCTTGEADASDDYELRKE